MKESFLQALKILVPLVLLLLLGWFVYSFFNSPKPTFGKLPLPLVPNTLVNRPTWDNSALKVEKKDKEKVYKVKDRGFSVEEAKAISKKLGFTSSPKFLAGETLFWQEEVKNLSINTKTGLLEYHDIAFSKTDLGKVPIDEGKVKNKVRNFASLLDLNTDLVDFESPQLKFLKYIPGGSEAAEVEKQQANLVVLNYPVKIKGESLLGDKGIESLAVKVVGDGQIVSLEFVNLSIEEEGTAYPLKNEKNIKEVISKGEAGLATIKDSVSVPLTNPKEIFVGQGKTFLYNDDRTAYIQPVFVFEVILIGGSNKSEGEIYLPAVDKKYFK